MAGGGGVLKGSASIFSVYHQRCFVPLQDPVNVGVKPTLSDNNDAPMDPMDLRWDDDDDVEAETTEVS